MSEDDFPLLVTSKEIKSYVNNPEFIHISYYYPTYKWDREWGMLKGRRIVEGQNILANILERIRINPDIKIMNIYTFMIMRMGAKHAKSVCSDCLTQSIYVVMECGRQYPCGHEAKHCRYISICYNCGDVIGLKRW